MLQAVKARYFLRSLKAGKKSGPAALGSNNRKLLQHNELFFKFLSFCLG